MWIHEPITKAEWDAAPDRYDMFNGFDDISINQRGYGLLKGLSTSIILEDSLAENIVRFYEDHLIELTVALNELSIDFTNNWQHFKNYDWPVDFYDFNKSDSYFKYLTENLDAKRRMSNYSSIYSGYVWELQRYNTNAQKLAEEIDASVD